MLGLPSTTEVGRRLPKEAFYRNLKLDAKTRDEFVHLIESVTIATASRPRPRTWTAAGACTR